MAHAFVPAAQAAGAGSVAALAQFLRAARRRAPTAAVAAATATSSAPSPSRAGGGGGVVVLTGAGCSTESGIPDYRSPGGSYSVGHKPTTHQDFVRNEAVRKRFWARSLVGWKYFDACQPNETHQAVRDLQTMMFAQTVVTQNVDGLHIRAGSRGTVELHGDNGVVRCMDCGVQYSRHVFQERVLQLNTSWVQRYLPNLDAGLDLTRVRADGDADLSDADFSAFVVPGCAHCGPSAAAAAAATDDGGAVGSGGPGLMKPDIVFFGGNMAKSVRDAARAAVERSSGMLLLGTSAQVFSAYRLCRLAVEELGLPLAIVNIGETRADHLADLKVEARVGDILPRVVDALRADESS